MTSSPPKIPPAAASSRSSPDFSHYSAANSPPPQILTSAFSSSSSLVDSASASASAAASVSASPYRSVIPTDTFDPSNPSIKRDIIACVLQWLCNEGYHNSMLTLHDESNLQMGEFFSKRARLKRIRKSLIEGDWIQAEKFCTKATVNNHRSVLYEIYKQQYLEMIDKQEFQKAFAFLQRRLKPLESLKNSAEEFSDLCYLLSCKSVAEAQSFRDWSGALASRERLVQRFEVLTKLDSSFSFADFSSDSAGNGQFLQLQPNRLNYLLQQAMAYQIEFSPIRSVVQPKIESILVDYQPSLTPNSLWKTLRGHTNNVKSIAFMGNNGEFLVSGGSDNTVRLWSSGTGELLETLNGHSSRVWTVAADPTGSFVLSGSADSTVNLWPIANRDPSKPVSPVNFSSYHTGDVYSVSAHPTGTHFLSAGYDRQVLLFDVETGKLVRVFNDHSAAVCSAIFNAHGNLIVSGSKDHTIKFFDLLSGVCVQTYSSHLSEVTSVALNSSGSYLLSSSKDNSNRLFDVRTCKPVQRYKGHQNVSKNFIKSAFACNEKLVVSGSEDAIVYLWDRESGKLVQKLSGHSSCCYEAKFNQSKCVLASAAHDDTIKFWSFDAAAEKGESQTQVASNNYSKNSNSNNEKDRDKDKEKEKDRDNSVS